MFYDVRLVHRAGLATLAIVDSESLAIVDSESLADTYPYLDNVMIGGRTQAEHDMNVQCLLEVLKNGT